MTCTKCDICKYTIRQCEPRGAESPVIYFVGEAPGPEESKAGIPFVGRAGKYLFSIIDEFGLNDNNCRFWNIVRCYPQISEENKKFRAPSPEEIEKCKINVYGDIVRCNPRVIIALGATAARTFLGEDFTAISKVRGNKYMKSLSDNGSDFIVIPTYHPSYLMRQPDNEKIHNEFKRDIKFAISVSVDRNYESNDSNDVYSDTDYRDCSAKTIEIRTYKEFNEFCKKYIDKYPMVGYDVETNAKETHSVEHRIIGFSLASGKDIGCYVIIDSLDYTMGNIDKRLVEKRLRKILSSKKILVYNSQHEIPVTLNWLDIDISHNIEDLFIKVKIMNSDAVTYQ